MTLRPSAVSSASQMIAVCARGSDQTVDHPTNLLRVLVRVTVDAVVRRVQLTLGEPLHVAMLETTVEYGLERTGPGQHLACALDAISRVR